MSKIQKLAPEVIRNIAAGQVVEDPASVVKELVENALDAECTSISVHLENGGYGAIEVVDDGFGMDAEDLQLAYLPQTTSKIRTLDDITRIASYGFRGEALASIAAVSSLTIESRQPSAPGGWQVCVENGTLVESKPVGMIPGTRVTVSNLFQSVPVRKKQRVSVPRQLRRIVRLISAQALAHEKISFDLFNGKKHILHLPAGTDLQSRIGIIHGPSYAEALIQIDYSDHDITVKGVAGPPEIARAQQQAYIFVNKRLIENTDFHKAVKKAFGTVLNPHQKPFAVLHISFPHDWVDVNVDPQKRLVRFRDQAHTVQTLTDVLKDAIGAYMKERLAGYRVSNRYKLDKTTQSVLHDAYHAWNEKALKDQKIIQIDACYLAFQGPEGMLMIDQHAAHERILYEAYMENMQGLLQEPKVQHLQPPVRVLLSLQDAAVIAEYQSHLTDMGFTFSMDGSDSVLLESVPEHFVARDFESLLQEIIQALAEGDSQTPGVDAVTHATVTYISCRNAVKRGDTLSEEDARSLIVKLFQCENPHTCPHGRPAIVNLTKKELGKMFHR